MKFERVSLEKYGSIATREIDLASMPGLVIIYGPNEAGKSTLLSAICDLLYGVPHTSPHGAIFGNNLLQIGATLRLADGSALSLRRKKGRTAGALVDGAGVPVSAERLDMLLAGTDRDRFTSLFGLNHASLRQGGQELLAADGEIGRLIVEAGGGLRALVDALKELEAEADTLFSATRSSKRRFYPALDAFQTADKAVKQATMTREAFVKATKAAQAASASLKALRQEQSSARELISRQGRLVRVAPQLRLLADADVALLEYLDIEDLPDGLAVEIKTTVAALLTEQTSHASAELSNKALQEQLDALVISADIVSAADEIDAAEALAVHVEKSLLDLPNRITERAESQARLNRLRASIGATPDEDLEARAPTRTQIDAVQSLAAKAITIQSDLTSTKDRLKETSEHLKGLRARQTEREAKGYNKPSPVSAADLGRIPTLAREIETKSKAVVESEKTLQAKVTSLGLGTIDGLSDVPWPGLPAVQREIDKATKATTEMGVARAAQTAAKTRGDRAAARIEKLSVGSEPPTPLAVGSARTARDEAWTVMRPPACRGGALTAGRCPGREDEAR